MRRGMPPGAVELSYVEKKVLLALGKLQKGSPEEIRAAGKFRELVEVMNAASWLQAKGLVTMKERVLHSYRLPPPEVPRGPRAGPQGPEAAVHAGGRLEGGPREAGRQMGGPALAVGPGAPRLKRPAGVSK